MIQALFKNGMVFLLKYILILWIVRFLLLDFNYSVFSYTLCCNSRQFQENLIIKMFY